MGEKKIRMYYMNCGVYNSFIDELLNLKSRIPVPLHEVSILLYIPSKGIRRLFPSGGGGGGGNFGIIVKKNIPLLLFFNLFYSANLIKNLKPKCKKFPILV